MILIGTIIISVTVIFYTIYIIEKKKREAQRKLLMISKGMIKKEKEDEDEKNYLSGIIKMNNSLNFDIFDVMENIGDNGWSDKKYIHKINHEGTSVLQDIYNNLRHYLSRTNSERRDNHLYMLIFKENNFIEKVIKENNAEQATQYQKDLLVISEAHTLVACKVSNLLELFINGTENEKWNNEQTVEEMKKSKNYKRAKKLFKYSIKTEEIEKDLSDEEIIIKAQQKVMRYL